MYTHPLLRTFPAYSLPIRRDTGIGLIEGMPMFAVGFVAAVLSSLPVVLLVDALCYAETALPVAFNPLGIFLCVLMAFEAARAFAVVVAPSPSVLLGSDRLHMGRVHTVANSAEMVDHKAFGDRANHLFVDQPVGNSDFILPVDVGIPSLRHATCADPALPRLPNRHMFTQHLIKSHADNHDNQCTRLLPASGVLT